jgi:NAD(P)-dependent dehydrogenase (short-subunit alcohol dehydrogenase family)
MPNMNGSLAGKVAFVTGAGGGIDRAAAQAFAREGASVVVADVDVQANTETARLIEEVGGQVVAARCDVTRAHDLQAALDVAVERFGGPDVAFNNAGIEQSGARSRHRRGELGPRRRRQPARGGVPVHEARDPAAAARRRRQS